jgi:hypothetical protein
MFKVGRPGPVSIYLIIVFFFFLAFQGLNSIEPAIRQCLGSFGSPFVCFLQCPQDFMSRIPMFRSTCQPHTLSKSSAIPISPSGFVVMYSHGCVVSAVSLYNFSLFVPHLFTSLRRSSGGKLLRSDKKSCVWGKRFHLHPLNFTLLIWQVPISHSFFIQQVTTLRSFLHYCSLSLSPCTVQCCPFFLEGT